jgi:multidrug efflux pump subunit AcrB
VELEPNATLKHTKNVTDSLQKILLADKRVKSVTAFVGTGAPRFHATYGPKVPGEGMAQMIVNTVNPKATDAIIKEYEKAYEFHFPEAQIRFKQLDYQAVTAPVMVTFRGGSAEVMEPFAMELKKYMMTEMENTLKWVHSDCDRSVSTVSVDLDPEESSRLGVNRALLSLSIAKTLNGQTVASVWEGKKSIPINFYNSAIKPDMSYEELGNQLVSTSLPGVSVPLRQVADISPIWQPEGIAHTGGKNSITVYADMRSGCSQPNSVKVIRKYVDEHIRPNLPEGVEIQYAGLTATNAKVVPEVMMVLVCAIIILFGFLLYHFKKILLSLLTIVLSLLCLFGATFGLWIFNLDFSITAVLGVVSLIGIVVRNGILMFEYAETLRFEFGYDVREAAAEAGKRRMRPIFLTSCTTALGVLPMILSGDILWMPMGVVICFGTLLSIVLIVEIMPVCYWLIFRNEKKVKLIED